MKIAIIGAGNVGHALGKRWAAAGHTVIYGSRTPNSEKIQTIVAESGANASADSHARAAAAAEIVVIATPWHVTADVIKGLGDLSGKVIVDATNPIGANFSVATGEADSGAALVTEWAHGGTVVKAFNTTGFNNMENPLYDGEATTMFIAGDDADAKGKVTELSNALGFETVDVGSLNMARHLESVAFVWIHLAIVQGMGREMAFKIVKR